MLSVLNERQEAIFYHRCDVWRVDRPLASSTGEVGPDTTERVYSGEPCHYGYTQNIDTGTGAGRIVVPGQFTRDTITFSTTITIRNTDILVNVTPGSVLYGQVHRLEGDSQTVEGSRGRVGSQSFMAMVEKKPPVRIINAYGVNP